MIQIEPARLPGETFPQYKTRQRLVHKAIKHTLRYGRPATHARLPKVRQWTLSPSPMAYIPGPHKSHKPHEVTQRVDVAPWVDIYGIEHTQYEFTVMHPGTLVKCPAVK